MKKILVGTIVIAFLMSGCWCWWWPCNGGHGGPVPGGGPEMHGPGPR